MFDNRLHKHYFFHLLFIFISKFALKTLFHNNFQKKIALKKMENLSLIRDFLVDERMKRFLNYSSESEVI